MKRTIVLLAIAAALASCSEMPPVTGSIITPQGEVRIHPDGQVEIVVRPLSDK